MSGAGRVASLGMYDQPWLVAANDALWAGIARQLRQRGIVGTPPLLDRARPLGRIWRDPDLLVAQTCGYPLVTALAGRVTLVAAPIYDVPIDGAPIDDAPIDDAPAIPGAIRGATHRSVVIVAEAAPFRDLAALRGSRAAINGRDSNTGMNLFRRALADVAEGRPMFSAVVETGGHIASLEAVRGGSVDVAAIDSVTLALTRRHRPDLAAGVRVIAATPPSPTLPFITRAGAGADEVAALRAALAAAIADPELASATAALGLVGIAPARRADYDILTRYAEEAAAMAYPDLA